MGSKLAKMQRSEWEKFLLKMGLLKQKKSVSCHILVDDTLR